MLVRQKSLVQKIDDKGCDGPSCAVRLLVVIFTYKSLKRGKEIDRGKSRFALYRSAVNRGFTVLT